MTNVISCLNSSVIMRNICKFNSRFFAHSCIAGPQLKPFSEVPGPLKLPVIGNAYLLPFYFLNSKSEASQLKTSFEKYGSIYREKMGQTEIVHTKNAQDVEKIYRSEGKYPSRISVECWKRWRDENGLSKGVLTEEGETWKKLRKHFDKPMLTRKFVSTYVDGFNAVGDDFLENISKTASRNGGLIANIEEELFHWSIENITNVLFEIRLGALSDQRSEETTKFIEAVQGVFLSTQRIFYTTPSFNRIFFRKWQLLHDESWNTVFNLTTKLINNKVKEIEVQGRTGQETTGYMSYLTSTNLSLDEIYGTAAEIMFGAVDTTSVSMQWILYELANHPSIQEELHKEITSHSEIKAIDDLADFPLLKAFLKETLRLYPVALVASRILEDDTELSGFLIPKNTTVLANMFIIGRSEENFEDPTSFKPHRWLRANNGEHLHTFAWLPFGFGQRSCIGRRLAELEIYTLLSKIVRTFMIEKVEPEPIVPVITGLLTLSRPVNVRFIRRA